MDFYTQVGKVAIGSRLRRLSDRLTEDAASIYALYGVDLDPKWFPVFYVLSQRKGASITEIAQLIGHSHPSVSQIVKEMAKGGMVILGKDEQDARVSVVQLSDRGNQLLPQFKQQYRDVTEAVEQLLSATQHDLWQAIEEVEFLLDQESVFDRVKAVRKMREVQSVILADYRPEFRDDFKRLNCEWIETYFQLEAADYQSLNHPEEKILNPGGHIYLALIQNEVVGTCALIKVDAETYELAKMAVTESARGKGIGWLLGQAAIHKARELGARTIVLESNTKLKPAIHLYQKLGFRKVVGKPSAYDRCNIQMELTLA